MLRRSISIYLTENRWEKIKNHIKENKYKYLGGVLVAGLGTKKLANIYANNPEKVENTVSKIGTGVQNLASEAYRSTKEGISGFGRDVKKSFQNLRRHQSHVKPTETPTEKPKVPETLYT